MVASGCSPVAETIRTVWGSSTRALEDARESAIKKTYRCPYDDCFDVVLSLARNEPVLTSTNPKFFDVFIKDRIKSHIVVMGIKGNVDTTEVGIFLMEDQKDVITFEVSSLSTTAKEKVAKAVFEELDRHFTAVN